MHLRLCQRGSPLESPTSFNRAPHALREHRFARGEWRNERTSQTSPSRIGEEELLPFQMKTMTGGNCDFPVPSLPLIRMVRGVEQLFKKMLKSRCVSLAAYCFLAQSVCVRGAFIVGRGLFYATPNFPSRARAPAALQFRVPLARSLFALQGYR